MAKIIVVTAVITGLMFLFGSFSPFINAQVVLKTIGSHGSGPGQLNDPRGLYVNNKGNLYVVDSGNNRIQVFDTNNGKFIRAWGSFGTTNGQFNHPLGIALDYNLGYVYI